MKRLEIRDDHAVVIKPSPAGAYGAQVRQLRHLLVELGRAPAGLTREEIQTRCEVSRATFYRLVLMAETFDVRIEARGPRGRLRYRIADFGWFDPGRLVDIA
ncbi:MAG: hypothetical protein K2W80_20175 [Burkholderiales bacterium]|nr:hypothetical protein [Burkholderiales bacterium]